jgi:uncharacterized protein YjeT (DUF2065 family)
VRSITLWLLAPVLAGDGLFMLLAPEAWYHMLPTVPATGAFNAHFVRDIGAAYLVVGGALAWLALGRAGGHAAALTGGAFLGLHAAVHLWDATAGRASLAHLAQDVPLVIVVPALVVWLAWPRSPAHR